jgi:hypothetical protein
MGNYQKPNPFSNNYNLGWKDHPNFKWNQNKPQGTQQTAQPMKPSPLKETLNQFIKASQYLKEIINSVKLEAHICHT